MNTKDSDLIYSTNDVCDVVRRVAIKNSVKGLDPALVKFCVDGDFIVQHSPAKLNRWGTRPEGRKMLAQRIADDQKAVVALLK
jgi:hypothetical protein